MSLVSIIVALLLAGGILAIISLLPIDATVQRIMQIVLLIVIAIWLVTHFWPGALGR